MKNLLNKFGKKEVTNTSGIINKPGHKMEDRITDTNRKVLKVLTDNGLSKYSETSGNFTGGEKLNLWYEPWAIAQHYEFAAPMIDTTNEISVAAFFATHQYDRVTKSYTIAKEGVGKIRWRCCLPGIIDDV